MIMRSLAGKFTLLRILTAGLLMAAVTACSALRTTGRIVGGTGKAAWTTAKVAGKVAKTTGDVAWKTGELTHKGVRTVVYMAKGREIIPLRREGNSLYADVVLNRGQRARFLVDTGASNVHISQAMARALGINFRRGEPVTARLAGGAAVQGYRVTLKEVRLQGARIRNVPAIVLDRDSMQKEDGLLGMSFLNHFQFSINANVPELVLEQQVVN